MTDDLHSFIRTDDPVERNAELRRRAELRNAPPPASDRDKLLSGSVTGIELAEMQERENARGRLEAAQQKLRAQSYRIHQSESNYHAYCRCYDTVEQLMRELSALTGETYDLPAMLPNPFAAGAVRKISALAPGHPDSERTWDNKA